MILMVWTSFFLFSLFMFHVLTFDTSAIQILVPFIFRTHAHSEPVSLIVRALLEVS